MKGPLSSIILVILSFATGMSAIIPDGPAETIYWRQFNAVLVAGNQILAVGSKGVVTFDWNEQGNESQPHDYVAASLKVIRRSVVGI